MGVFDRLHSEEKTSLIISEENEANEYYTTTSESPPANSTFLGLTRKAIITHTVFTILNVFLSLFWLLKQRSGNTSYPFNSIAAEAVQWETQFFDVDIGHRSSPYTGLPSYDLDLAWHKLFANSNLRISQEEMDVMDEESVPFADGSGYWVNLDVYHQLHCLKFLRWYVYPEYYDFRLNNTNIEHADHCIENLRRNIMCMPSLDVLMLEWKPEKIAPQPRFSYSHTCVNWEKIDAWAGKRAFDSINSSQLFKNPIFDPALAEEEELE